MIKTKCGWITVAHTLYGGTLQGLVFPLWSRFADWVSAGECGPVWERLVFPADCTDPKGSDRRGFIRMRIVITVTSDYPRSSGCSVWSPELRQSLGNTWHWCLRSRHPANWCGQNLLGIWSRSTDEKRRIPMKWTHWAMTRNSLHHMRRPCSRFIKPLTRPTPTYWQA